MARLMQQYREKIAPQLAQSLKRTNPMSIPRLEKIVISMGFGRAATQGEKARMEEATKSLTTIAGQKPLITQARTSVSGFKLREGMKIGCKTTLRGKRMYEFLDRLINTALPRVRDFRGINPRSFDGSGNYNMGLSEQIVFPEIEADKLQFSQGMNICMVIQNSTDDESLELLKLFGMPFRT